MGVVAFHPCTSDERGGLAIPVVPRLLGPDVPMWTRCKQLGGLDNSANSSPVEDIHDRVEGIGSCRLQRMKQVDLRKLAFNFFGKIERL